MNWLFVSDGKNEDFKTFLKTKFEKINFFDLDVSQNSNCKKEDLNKVLIELSHFVEENKISHCVFFGNPIDFDKEFIFLYGFLCGKNIPIFLVQDFSSCLFKNVYIYKDLQSFKDYVENNFNTIQNEFTKKEAFDFLYENGIPFDADNFASCIVSGKKNICEYYLKAGMSVNSRDRDGTPMLNVAARSDRLDFVQWLVEKGADIKATSEDRGYTAIMDAVWRGNVEITHYLIKQGSDLNTINKEGQSMLVLAVGANRTQICKLLAENGANPDIPDSMGMSAYGYAKLFKKTEIADILEKYHKE